MASNVYAGIVKATYPNAGPNDPAAVKYDVVYIDDTGAEQALLNVASAIQQTNVQIWPARKGQPCIVVRSGDVLRAMVFSAPYFEDCPEAGGGGSP